jgi:glycosyltransferase 2 family protein
MRRFETLILLLALSFYVWFLRRFGLAEIVSYIRLAGWGLALTIALESLSRIANTLGWRVTITDYPHNLRFGELFVARISGEAIDYVTPSAQLGGQFVMAMMVRRKLAMAIGLATVVVASLAEAIGQIGFISAALMTGLPFEARLHHLFWPMMGGLALAIGFAVGFFILQMKQPFSMLWKGAAKLNLGHLADPEVKAAAAEADGLLIDFYRRHRGRLALSCLFYLFAWSMGPVEIYILMTLLHQPATIITVLLVEALGLLIERATFLIPAKLVSQEGGKALILSTLGYPAGVGFAIGVLRRLKEMVWVLIGLAALAAHRMINERAGVAAASQTHNVIEVPRAHGGQSL